MASVMPLDVFIQSQETHRIVKEKIISVRSEFRCVAEYFLQPVQEIIDSMRTGTATTILSGLSVGMESTVWALVVIVISFILAMLLYQGDGAIYVLYAVAMIGIGIAGILIALARLLMGQ